MQQAITAATRDAYVSGHAQGQLEGQQVGYQNGYQIGRAHGELIGRDAVTLELQQEFGSDNHNTFGPDEALRVASRTRH